MNILEIYEDRIRRARGLSADAFYVQELHRLELERSVLNELIAQADKAAAHLEEMARAGFGDGTVSAPLRAALAGVSA